MEVQEIQVNGGGSGHTQKMLPGKHFIYILGFSLRDLVYCVMSIVPAEMHKTLWYRFEHILHTQIKV